MRTKTQLGVGPAWRASTLLGLVPTILAACSAPVSTQPVASASIATEGVSIRAADGTFTLEAGRGFEPPFFGRCYNLPAPEERALAPAAVVEGAAAAEARGARRVEVRVPGRDRPLLGLLLFCEAPVAGIGPSARSYRLSVPDSYVAQAEGGRVSVVYERVRRRGRDGSERWWYGWVLWLSDQPFL